MSQRLSPRWTPAHSKARTEAIQRRYNAGALTLPVLAVLAVLVIAGYGMTYFSGLPLLTEERLFYGLILGAMAGTLATFLIALVVGLNVVSIVGGTAVVAVAGAAGLVSAGEDLRREFADLRARWFSVPSRKHPWPLLLVMGITWPYSIRLVRQALYLRPDGLWTGSTLVINDWAGHLTIAASFAYGHNFPPQWFVDPGHPLAYPFMMDFFAAELVRLGSSLADSLVITSGFLGLAVPVILYLAARRILGGRLDGLFTTAIFLLSGGLGFLYLVPDVDQYGFRSLVHLRHDYTVMLNVGITMRTATLQLLAQRDLLFGVAIVLIVLALLYTALSVGDWRTFGFAGAIVGLAPLFHVHGFGTALVLPAFWAVFDRRREWIAFFLPAVVLAIPSLLFLSAAAPPAADCSRLLGHGPCLDLGWRAASMGRHNVVWFWLENAGLFIPLLLLAQFLRTPVSAGIGRLSLPMWCWFIAPQIWQFHPNEWDNSKFIYYWWLVGSLPVAGLLAWVARRSREGAILSGILLFTLCMSGTLDLARAVDLRADSHVVADSNGLAAAQWVRVHTPPSAVVAAAPEPTEPVLDLSGRRMLIGWDLSVQSLGLTDYVWKERDLAAILEGAPSGKEVARRDHVSYVVLGPEERQDARSIPYWNQNAKLVYHNGEYRVYRVGG